MSAVPFATLVVFHNGFGDYIMALPTLRALCAFAPRPLCLVAGAGPHAFVLADLDADRTILVPFVQDWPRKDFDPAAVLTEVSSCDLLISLCPYSCAGQTHLIERLAPARALGFAQGFAGNLGYAQVGHEIDILFQPARLLASDARPADFDDPLPRSPSTRSRLAALRAALEPGASLIVLHLDTRPDKSLAPSAVDASLAVWLRDHPQAFAVALNQEASAFPRADACGRVRGMRGTSLEQAMAIAAEADLLVGVDSCMLHAADHARRAQLGLFGPTDPLRTGAYWVPAHLARMLRGPGGAMTFAADAITETGLELLARLRQ